MEGDEDQRLVGADPLGLDQAEHDPLDDRVELVVAAARDLSADLPIIARATTQEGIKHLAQLGAQHVIHPELEGGLEIVRHTLLKLNFPVTEVMRYMDAVRDDRYDVQVNTEEEHRLLHDLIHASGNIEVTWTRLEDGNPLIGQTLAEANLLGIAVPEAQGGMGLGLLELCTLYGIEVFLAHGRVLDAWLKCDAGGGAPGSWAIR